MNFIQPQVFLKSFTCPYCSAIAQQNWWHTSFSGNRYPTSSNNGIRVSHCQHCEEYTLWVWDNMVYPTNGNAPSPNGEMPEAVKKIYLEACSIYQKSPRGAAALLRLGIQMLCKELGENGTNINNDIKNLVEKGLPEIVQKSLDIVRVTGNDAVHPGQIDTDDPNTVARLFELTNIVVQYMITLPKQVGSLYDSLPTDKVEAISKRDKTN
ncbi:DUF4145 domain-containing protein [Pedobacter caeni]|uniref:DUF4145 domain-containing protein n=1 Tax=Pedobacter caeni TaxID=288992 RepID=A0A1M4VC11_9SPHI|nr:DUF4145 domain-containing protein [Pedobacter caeni]SHE66443.1 protein of unknown function [Pedobacter caeni]